MKKSIVAVCFLATSLAWGNEETAEETETTSEVDLRVSVLEHIVVTSDKAPSLAAEELDPEIEAILEEADALEEDDDQE